MDPGDQRRDADRLIVSASGIRGVVGRALTPPVAARYGAAFATWLRGRTGSPGPVLLARDSRVSGRVLADAVAAGVRAGGCDVGDLGMVPTPTALLAVQDGPEAAGGVIVTASHNPAPWNGLKLAGEGGEFLSARDGREVQEIYDAGPEWAAWDGLGRSDSLSGAEEHHVERILGLSLLEPERLAGEGFRVALDTVRGAAGPVMERLLSRLGCEVAGVDLEPDGRFPRDPEPRPENLERLTRRVREAEAELGMAVDPDGDRLALVDGGGRPVGEDLTLALAADYVLSRTKGPVVTNLSSSRVIVDVAERHGCRVYRAPVGEANVARRMREVDAVVGGEGNGGVMLPELHLTRDAPLAATLVLALLTERGQALADVVSGLPVYHIDKRSAPRPEGPLDAVYARLVDEAPAGAEEDRQDGLRLTWPGEGRWLHVRPSGTEPIVRVLAEAPDAEGAEELTGWALEVVRSTAA